MNKLTVIVSGVGFGLIGFAFGVKRGHKLGRDSVKENAKDFDQADVEALVRETDDLISELNEKKSEKDKDEPPKTEKEILETKDLKEDEYVPYYKPEEVAAMEKKWDKAEDFDKISVEFLDEEDEDDDDGAEEAEEEMIRERDAVELYLEENPEPHLITGDQYFENEFLFDQESWTYYKHDDIVVDFHNNIITDPYEIIADLSGQLENEEDDSVIYIRNADRNIEIELILDIEPYAESYAYKRQKLQEMAAAGRLNGES